MATKKDLHTVLDSLSQFLSTNIGYISEGLILNQKDMAIESRDILAIVQSLLVIRDQIEDKVVEIKHVMDGRPANGEEPTY